MPIEKLHRRLLFPLVCLFFFTTMIAAQTEPASRGISPADFQKQRKKSTDGKGESKTAKVKLTPKQAKNLAVITNSQRRYALVERVPTKQKATEEVKPNPPAQKAILKEEQLGVTFWRLRPMTDDDGDVPLFPVRIGDGRENWTAERVNSKTKFKIGDRVRFTVESSRTGYLYIINRELYTDGSGGKYDLIFPTLRTRGGNNRVAAGSLIEIPASNDSVPYFTIRPRRADYFGEEIIVLITKDKLDFEIGLQAIPVNNSQVEKWFADWGATVDVYDAEDGEGIAETQTEALAANSATRSLVQEEPLPQTIYKLRIGSETSLLVHFRMMIAEP